MGRQCHAPFLQTLRGWGGLFFSLIKSCGPSWLGAVVVALGWLVHRLILEGTNLLCLNRRQHSGVFAEPQVLPHLHCAVERLHDVLHDRVSPTPLCPWEGVTLPPIPTTCIFPLTGHFPDASTVGNLLILCTPLPRPAPRWVCVLGHCLPHGEFCLSVTPPLLMGCLSTPHSSPGGSPSW